MQKYVVLYNPLSNNKKGEESAREAEKVFENGEFSYKSVLEIKSYAEYFKELSDEYTVILAGGDGTLNKFVNNLNNEKLTRDVYYFPAGSGNDFMHDVSEDGKLKYIKLNPYVENLPTVEINGKKSLFINGIGFGIDGYCCEVGDELRKTTDKPINYAGIAIKGLLFHFKPVTATINTDGVERVFKNAWLAPTMNGRFYGGGMNATPTQDRLNKELSLTTMVFYGKSRIGTLMKFPGIFKGEHIKHKNAVTLIKGYRIKVTFDRPCALQIDGETVLNVTSYEVYH